MGLLPIAISIWICQDTLPKRTVSRLYTFDAKYCNLCNLQSISDLLALFSDFSKRQQIQTDKIGLNIGQSSDVERFELYDENVAFSFIYRLKPKFKIIKSLVFIIILLLSTTLCVNKYFLKCQSVAQFIIDNRKSRLSE